MSDEQFRDAVEKVVGLRIASKNLQYNVADLIDSINELYMVLCPRDTYTGQPWQIHPDSDTPINDLPHEPKDEPKPF